MACEIGPFAGDSAINIRYTLEPTERATRVIRSLDMTMRVPALLKPLVIHAFRKENVRILAELKRYVEALPKQDTLPKRVG